MTDFEIDRIVRLEGTDFDRRRKLKTSDITTIRRMYSQGYSIPYLAAKYHVAYITIKYHVDDLFKKQQNKIRAAYGSSSYYSKDGRKDRIEYKKSLLKNTVTVGI